MSQMGGDSAIAAANPSSPLTNATSECADEHRAVLEALPPKKVGLDKLSRLLGVLLRLLVFAVLSTRHSALLQGMTGRVCVS